MSSFVAVLERTEHLVKLLLWIGCLIQKRTWNVVITWPLFRRRRLPTATNYTTMGRITPRVTRRETHSKEQITKG